MHQFYGLKGNLVRKDSSQGLRHFLLDDLTAKKPIRRRRLTVRGCNLRLLRYTFTVWCRRAWSAKRDLNCLPIKGSECACHDKQGKKWFWRYKNNQIALTLEAKGSKKKLNCVVDAI